MWKLFWGDIIWWVLDELGLWDDACPTNKFDNPYDEDRLV